jgi:hypothetical protein
MKGKTLGYIVVRKGLGGGTGGLEVDREGVLGSGRAATVFGTAGHARKAIARTVRYGRCNGLLWPPRAGYRVQRLASYPE